MNSERLQKVLAKSGYGSRRQCETLISSGRVQVNGKLATLGMKADPKIDRIVVDGKPIRSQEKKTYIALYKPRGYISSTKSVDERKTILDLVDIRERLFPVGRLDVDSEGLVLLTNDGKIAHILTHPRFGHEKEYKVLVARQPDERQLRNWRRGIILEDGYRTVAAEVVRQSSTGQGSWLRITLKEGRKRQIREVGNKIGLPVVKIIRVRIGTLKLGNLKPGKWRFLTRKEVSSLYNLTG